MTTKRMDDEEKCMGLLLLTVTLLAGGKVLYSVDFTKQPKGACQDMM